MFLCSRGKRLKASASALMSLEATRTSVRGLQPRSGLMSFCSYVLMFSALAAKASDAYQYANKTDAVALLPVTPRRQPIIKLSY